MSSDALVSSAFAGPTKVLESILTTAGIDVYRWKTRLHAAYQLATLTDDEIESFMGSYILFEGDWSHDNGKKETHIVDYYHVINHLCSLGNVEKMYIPPVRDLSATVTVNQELYEKKMMSDCKIPLDGSARVLDIGCGRGRVASHVCRETGAHVSGINIDPSQIANARQFAARTGLGDKTKFVVGSLNDPLPFPDGHFDAVYEIQAFTYAKDRDAVMREVYRVLKPGGRFSFMDWVLLPPYDPNNEEHVDLVKKTAPFIGSVEDLPVEDFIEPMKKAGFEVVLSADASIAGHGSQAPLIMSERNTFAWVRYVVKFGVMTRILPQKFPLMLQRLKKHAEAFQKGDEMGIFTTSYQIVVEKRADAK